MDREQDIHQLLVVAVDPLGREMRTGLEHEGSIRQNDGTNILKPLMMHFWAQHIEQLL